MPPDHEKPVFVLLCHRKEKILQMGRSLNFQQKLETSYISPKNAPKFMENLKTIMSVCFPR